MELNVVSLAFRCHVITGHEHTTPEARRVEWLPVKLAQERMPEARFIRVTDALRSGGPFVRTHDGAKLL